jgi:hypothetical protein
MGTTRSATVPTTADWVTTIDDVVDTSHLTARSLRRTLSAIGVAVAFAGVVAGLAGDAGLCVELLLFGPVVLVPLFFRPLERVVVGRGVADLVGRACEVEAVGDGLAFRQAGATGTLAWSALTGVVEDARTIALTSGRRVRFAIPKRAFDSPDHASAFAGLVRGRIAAAGSAGSPGSTASRG